MYFIPPSTTSPERTAAGDPQGLRTERRPLAARALVRDLDGCRVRQVMITRRSEDAEDDGAIVRVAYAGVCRTDLYAADGKLETSPGVVLGQEASGIVESIERPASTDLRVGDHVTVIPRVRCGHCGPCDRGGGPLACDRPLRLGIDRDGVFTERARLPVRSLAPVPKTLSLRAAAYVEPVAAALAVIDPSSSGPADVRPTDRILIYGSNRIADLTRRILLAFGAEGVTIVNDSVDASRYEAGSFDVAIETVATNETLPALLRAVRRRGAILLKSRPLTPVALDINAAVEKEITLRAVRYAPFEVAIDWLVSGRLDLDDLFGDSFALDNFEDAFRAARRELTKPFFAFAFATDDVRTGAEG